MAKIEKRRDGGLELVCDKREALALLAVLRIYGVMEVEMLEMVNISTVAIIGVLNAVCHEFGGDALFKSGKGRSEKGGRRDE